MKRYLLRVLVGSMAFGVGISVARFFVFEKEFYLLPKHSIDCDTQTRNLKKSISPSGEIEIRFQGSGRIENRPTLKFEIINHNSNPAVYRSFEEKNIWTFVKFNGKQKEEWRCGTGMREFTLKSGESFEIEFQADSQIYDLLRKEGKFEFGYYFTISDKEAKILWSEPMKISDELKEDIIKNAPAYFKQR